MSKQDPSRRTQPPTEPTSTEDAVTEAEVIDAKEASQASEEASPPADDSYVASLEKKLSAQDLRLTQTLSQYKAALEEFESTKVRLRRDVARDVEAGKKKFLADLLEVLDNLERALEAAPAEGAEGGLKSGVTMVRDQFLLKLEAQGVRRVAARGEIFDPTCFEAISAVPVTDRGQDGRVVAVVRDAYRLGIETLRTGMVAVGKYKET